MNAYRRILCAAAACSLFAANLHASMPTAQFLLVGQGARAEAMGQSVVSNCYDASAAFWNPAGAAFIKHPEATFGTAQLPAEINSQNLSFVYPLKRLSLGLFLMSERTEMPSYNMSGDQLSSFNLENSLSGLLLAYRFTDHLAAGATLGGMKMSVPGSSADARNMTFGGLYTKDRLNLGVSLANMGGDVRFSDESRGEAQPAVFRAGTSYSFLRDRNLLLSGSLEKVVNDDSAEGNIGLGVEYLFPQYLTLRAGVKSIPDTGAQFAMGFGLRYSRFFLDFARTFAANGLEGTDVNRFNLGVKFGRSDESEGKTAARPTKPAALQRKSGEAVNMAVAEFSGKNVSQADASILSDFLRTELVNTGTINIVEKANMDKVLAESAFQQSGCTTSDCAVQIGKILNVRQMIVGSLSKLMDTYYITTNIVDVETGRIVASYDQDASSARELRAAAKTLAQRIAGLQ